MLKRYFFAGSFFCNRKNVLDTCCGLGWGTYIISHFAKSVTAFDIEPDVINYCRRTWPNQNIRWLVGDALKTSFINYFDIALGMETIEHFSKDDAKKYISEISKHLGENGIFIGTSSFPRTRMEADELCTKNPYHLYIHTESEMSDLLQQYFTEHKIISNWMFIAIK